jgi:STE24 endopeptidase
MLVGGVLASAGGFFVCDCLLGLVATAGGSPLRYATLPVWTLPSVMLILTVFFLLLEPVGNFFSRRRERQCDRYALRRTGLKAAYLSAFRKLARINKDDPDPHPLEVFLFHSHPPIAERLAMAEEERSFL